MGGGLMQLVAYGAQDIYLTGNPQITFFKVVYRRHTNFSMEAIEQTFNGTADFGKKVTCTVSRNGDLISRMYLQVTLPSVTTDGGVANVFKWHSNIGSHLVKDVEVEIGGQKIDKHYGEWLHIWNELTCESGKSQAYSRMVGNVQKLVNPHYNGASVPSYTCYVPLQFWFCRNPGLALPLIALQYHEVKVNLTFRDLADCYYGVGTEANKSLSLDAASLYVDYIYLDTDERRRFAQVSHEYLIEQLQFTGAESVTQNATNVKVKLNFNHPVKELVWVIRPENHTNSVQNNNSGTDVTGKVFGKQFYNFTDSVDYSHINGSAGNSMGAALTSSASGYVLGDLSGIDQTATVAQEAGHAVNAELAADANMTAVFDSGVNPTVSAKLQLNGHDRFSERNGDYFNYVQPYQHHTNTPATGINVYSFALKPEEHQPSGTCNMSRIDNASLNLQLTTNTTKQTSAQVMVYAVNYNVLRIMSGMAGLAYSN